MKKLAFLIMPLMTISFLTSCGEEKFTLTIDLTDCTVDGNDTYSRTYIKGETIEKVIVVPNETYVLNESSIDEPYKDYWAEGTDGAWVLSDLVMNSNHTIHIDPSKTHTITLNLNNCTVDGKSDYTRTYIKGEKIDDITVKPNYKYALTENSVSSEYQNNWSEGADGVWILSGLEMFDDYNIDVNPSETRTINLILNNCTVDGKDSYSRTYFKGEKINDITVNPGSNCALTKDSVPEEYASNWNEGENKAWILSELVMNDDYEITINASHEYTISIGTVDHLTFTTMDDNPLDGVKVLENRDFSFKMKSYNDPSNVNYIIPATIDIVVDKYPLLEGYSIEEITDTEAKVTIKASKIIGDITISGAAGIEGGYRYRMPYHYGLEELTPGVKNEDEDLTFTFIPSAKTSSNATYNRPLKENIYIKFDNASENSAQWISPAELEDVNDYCTYDETSGELTIKHNHIKSEVIIIARARDYRGLNELSWEAIDKVSVAGAAPYLFYVKETKNIKVNGVNHPARIIGFNHDDLSTGAGKAGITFEFINLVSGADKNGLTTQWHSGGRSDNYPESSFNIFLNNEEDGFLSKLESELKASIKSVTKKVGIGESKDKEALKTYKTKLFPLAYCEMMSGSEPGANEGTKYEYYKSVSRYNKTDLAGNNYPYWLRSPNLDNGSMSLSVIAEPFSSRETNEGWIAGAFVTENKYYAPAFCI